MKKENKKLAQERRAQERKRQTRKRITDALCKIGLPVLALAIVIGIMIVNPFAKKDTESGSGQNSSTVYNTDASLTVKDGDTVNIDFVGSIDGVEFEGGNTYGNGTDLVIGSNKYIDDFEEQLIGAHPGDKVDVYVTFPENYGKEDLNGKEALFKVTVNGIYR